jgi:hypothetical protein
VGTNTTKSPSGDPTLQFRKLLHQFVRRLVLQIMLARNGRLHLTVARACGEECLLCSSIHSPHGCSWTKECSHLKLGQQSYRMHSTPIYLILIGQPCGDRSRLRLQWSNTVADLRTVSTTSIEEHGRKTRTYRLPAVVVLRVKGWTSVFGHRFHRCQTAPCAY